MKEICLIINNKEADLLYQYLTESSCFESAREDYNLNGKIKIYKPELIKKEVLFNGTYHG